MLYYLKYFMRKIQMSLRIVLLLFLAIVYTDPVRANEKLAYWNQQRKGANGDAGAAVDSGTDPESWFKAASETGIDFVRLNPIDWQVQDRDFLIGNADNFETLAEEDLVKLKEVLDIAHKYKVKVLMTMFNLPGARNRHREHDYRLWTDEAYQLQALAFWTQLAESLRDHPAIVGYNPLNEPHPARKFGLYESSQENEFLEWLKKYKNTTTDLNRFNRRVVKAIRSVDTQTPIILDGWIHSSVEGMGYLEPVDDEAVLYAFHYYGPWIYSTYRINKGRFRYPDKMPVDDQGTTIKWTKGDIAKSIEPVIDWAKRNNIPANRIIAEEFGVDRRVGGAE